MDSTSSSESLRGHGEARLIPLPFQVLAFAWFLCLAVMIAWGLNKGLDITDEGSYLITYENPEDLTSKIRHDMLIIHTFFSPFDPGMLFYRWVQFCLNLFACLVFGWGLNRWCSAQGLGLGLLGAIAFTGLGNLMDAGFGPPTISYNHLVNYALLGGAGLLLASLAGRERHEPFLILPAGFAAGFVFFIKFTSSGALLFLFAMLMIFSKGRRPRRLVWLALGMVLGWAFFFLAVLDPAAWYHDFAAGWEMQLKSSIYSPSSTPVRYLGELWNLARPLLGGFLFLYVLLALCFSVVCAKWSRARLASGLIAICSLAAFYFLAEKQGMLWPKNVFSIYAWSMTVSLCLVVLLAQAAALAGGFSARFFRGAPLAGPGRPLAVVSLFLFFLPFAGSFGTGNNLAWHINYHIAPWFGLVLVWSAWLVKRRGPRSLSLFFMGIPALALSLHLFSVYVAFPYRLSESRFAQDKPVSLTFSDRLRGMLVDGPTKQMLEGLDKILLEETGFTPGDPIIAIYDMPGVVYALAGRSPGAIWLEAARPEEDGPRIVRKGLDDPARALLFINCPVDTALPITDRTMLSPHKTFPTLVSYLYEAGVAFPENYEPAGQAPISWDRWDRETLVHVFRPREKASP